MKFIADSAYNNNGSVFAGAIPSPTRLDTNEVFVTDLGVSFFRLDKEWDVSQKLAFVAALHKNLEKRDSQGLAAVSIAESDCSDCDVSQEFKIFYAGAKEVDPKIATIHCGSPISWENPQSRSYPGAEHYIDSDCRQDIPRTLLGIIKPTAADKVVPQIGWIEYEIGLLKIFAETQKDVEEALGVTLPGSRPVGESESSLSLLRRIAERTMRFHTALPTAQP